jgi:hypothetical protein
MAAPLLLIAEQVEAEEEARARLRAVVLLLTVEREVAEVAAEF